MPGTGWQAQGLGIRSLRQQQRREGPALLGRWTPLLNAPSTVKYLLPGTRLKVTSPEITGLSPPWPQSSAKIIHNLTSLPTESL